MTVCVSESQQNGNQVNNLSLIIAPVPKSMAPLFSLSTHITQRLVLNNSREKEYKEKNIFRGSHNQQHTWPTKREYCPFSF